MPSKPSSFLPIPLLAILLSVFSSGCGKPLESKGNAAVLSAAREKMLAFDFNGARDVLKQHRRQFSADSPDFPEYQYRLALAYWQATPPKENDVKEASRLLEEMARAFPDSPFAPAAWLYRGRILDIRDYVGDQPDWVAARAAYQTLFENYPASQEAGEAAVRFITTFIKEDQSVESITAAAAKLAVWLEQNEQRLEASSVALFLALVYDYYVPDPAAALTQYQLAERLGFVNQGRIGGYYWRMHKLALELGDVDLAISYAQRIVREFARSGRGYEAVRSLERIREAHPDKEFVIPTLQLFTVDKEESLEEN